ncbi:hypothetical protein Bca101_065429 [Brassica carinata]
MQLMLILLRLGQLVSLLGSVSLPKCRRNLQILIQDDGGCELCFACALFIEPNLLLLDEPTNHLEIPRLPSVMLMWIKLSRILRKRSPLTDILNE